MWRHTSASLQSASGFAFHSPCFASHASLGVLARDGDWSRRRPEIHASMPSSARLSGSTLRMAQHASGSRSHSLSPWTAAWRAMLGPWKTWTSIP